jgi:hypothetical protein
MVGQMGMEHVPSAVASSEKESRCQWLKRRVGNPVLLPLRLLKSFKRRRNNRLSKKDEFGAQSKKPTPDNYVFCELQSQPNATTAIKGWMFPDQRESVAMVARHLPKGWSLVVKESDRQWSRMYPRRRNFWAQMAAIPKVYVAPHGVSGAFVPAKRRLQDNKFIFLHLGEPYVRKGGQATVDAFLQEFEGNDDVLLLIKCYDEGHTILVPDGEPSAIYAASFFVMIVGDIEERGRFLASTRLFCPPTAPNRF